MTNTHTNTQVATSHTKLATAQKEKDRLMEVSEQLGYTSAQVELIMKTVAKGATVDEFLMFASVAKETGLNPLMKEIWFYKDNKGNAIIVTGRDGFLSLAQKTGQFTGLQSAVIFKNDKFSIDHSKSEVQHIYKQKERGNIVGAWAKSFRKGCVPNITYVDFDTYNKGWNTWKTHPQQMIIKCAEAISLKKTFGISGIMSQEELHFDPQDRAKEEIKNDEMHRAVINAIKELQAKDGLDKANDIINKELQENGDLTDKQRLELESLMITITEPDKAVDGEIIPEADKTDELLEEFEEKVENKK